MGYYSNYYGYIDYTKYLMTGDIDDIRVRFEFRPSGTTCNWTAAAPPEDQR